MECSAFGMCLCALNPLRKRERNRIVELTIEKTVKIFWAVFFLKNAENRVKLFWKIAECRQKYFGKLQKMLIFALEKCNGYVRKKSFKVYRKVLQGK